MALNIWALNSGSSIATITERTEVSLRLPLIGSTNPSASFKVISGKLPGGLSIKNDYIVGMPYEVARSTDFTFCVRASLNNEISDRTYKITIEGADEPTFITLEGSSDRLLDIGPNHQYFAVSETFVDYQLQAFDSDIADGQTLAYFIASDDGVLPPGLTLTKEGRIYGVIEPVLTLKVTDGEGLYDQVLYDIVPYSFASKSTNGYGTYNYDIKPFGFALPVTQPKSLTKNYEFFVTLTDGDSYVKRKFGIYVVGDDYFRADNTSLFNDAGIFTADVTYLMNPIWLTNSDLGIYRANNYILVKLDVYDTEQVVFSIDNEYNLPPGMRFDAITGDIFGRVPYQPAITKTYSFTVTAQRFSDKVEINTKPNGEVTQTMETASSSRTFTITIIGEIDSVISWITPADLGYINANQPATIKTAAICTDPSAVLIYKVTEGALPPGLTLDVNGEIVGSVTQFADSSKNKKGLITFDYNNGTSTTFDSFTTTFDRVYEFTVSVKAQYSVSTNTRQFKLLVNTPEAIAFSNIRAMPLLKPNQRNLWRDFISDPSIFSQANIYRTNDSNFGVQDSLSMLIYAGIETKEAAAYVSAVGLNHKRKRFQFGGIKKAYAKHNLTGEVLYEVVYIEMIDPLEPNGKVLTNIPISSVNKQIQPVTVDASNNFWDTTLDQSIDKVSRPARVITADSTGYQSSNSKPQSYPSSISLWRKRIKDVGSTEYDYLPLWMRSIQDTSKMAIGYISAIPLCFCKPGMGDDIMLNIKHSNFDFKLIDYTIDRYIIDAVDGNTNDKYLVFRNDRITI